MEQANKEVLEEDRLYVKKLVLNRPRQLNALSYFMVSKLLERFLAYEKDPDVRLIMMQGKGRAFCAGGDVANVVRDIRGGSWRSGAGYFQKEFTLNYVLATYSKIQVSILNGIVMGGGAGASVHGRFRVATENTVFAMPETALGLFPDIGASFFLSRLPGFFGNTICNLVPLWSYENVIALHPDASKSEFKESKSEDSREKNLRKNGSKEEDSIVLWNLIVPRNSQTWKPPFQIFSQKMLIAEFSPHSLLVKAEGRQ